MPVLTMLLVASALVAGGPSPAAAAGAGAIIVDVTAWSTGAPAGDGCVEAYGGDDALVASDCVGVDGTFTVQGLADGDYRLRFTGFAGAPTQWSDRASSLAAATPLTVAGAPVHVDYALLPTLSISGRVTDGAGAPLEGVSVIARGPVGTWAFAPPNATAVTDADGRYVLITTGSGYFGASYNVAFKAPAGLASEAWRDQPFTLGVTVSAGNATVAGGIDAVLTAGGSLGGTIAIPDGQTVPGDACVIAYDGQFYGGEVGRRCGPVGSDFLIEDLKPGPYAVCVVAAGATSCPTWWFGGNFSTGHGSATQLDVSGGQTTHVDLAWGGTVEVAVTLDNGAPLEGGCLLPGSLASRGAVESCDPVGGVFTFHVDTDVSANIAYPLTGAENALDQYLYTTTIVTSGGTTRISVTAAASGDASATVAVVREDGASITAGCIDARLHGPAGTVVKASDCTLKADGTADFTGLPAGDFTFESRGVPGTYTKVTYPDAINAGTGETVTLAGSEHADLHFTLPTSQIVRGTALDPDGVPVVGRQVALVTATGVVATTESGMDGTYELVAPVISGRVVALGGGLAQAWSGSLLPSTYGAATIVTGPSKERVVAPVDLKPRSAGRMLGTIATPDTLDATEACVIALDPTVPLELARDCGEVGDPFVLDGLAGGSYRLCVAAAPASGGCFDGDSPGVVSGSSAAPVTYAVVAATDTSVSLAFGGTVTVEVRTQAGAAVLGGCAQLYEGATLVVASCDGVDGTFTLTVGHDVTAVAPTVKVVGADLSLDSGAVTLERVRGGRAQTVTVRPSPWPSIKGTIARPAVLADADACVQITDGDGFWGTCVEAGTSSYAVQVPPGSYLVKFYSNDARVAYEWYPDQATSDTATWITVSSYDRTVNASLDVGAQIRGTVTTSTGEPATDGCVLAYLDRVTIAMADCDMSDGYALESLRPGTYSLRFVAFPGQASEWFDGASTYDGSADVPLAAGDDRVIDYRLGGEPASVSGRVTVAGLAATSGCVEVDDAYGDFVTGTCDLTDGAFSIDDLGPGTYYVAFYDVAGGADAWFGGSTTIERATRVTLARGSAFDASIDLVAASSIAGRATGIWADGGVLGTAELYTVTGEWVASVDLELDGTYVFAHVAPGQYRVRFWNRDVFAGGWARHSGSLVPRVVTVPATGPVAITGVGREFEGNYASSVQGMLNVPRNFTSDTVCAVAVEVGGSAQAFDCGAPGSLFELEPLSPVLAYRIAFTDGRVETSNEFLRFTGRKVWLGNVASLAEAPWYSFPERTVYGVSVHFFGDVTWRLSGYANIMWMADAGITTGYADGTFGPNDPVTRRQMAQFLYRFAGQPTVTAPPTSPFPDVRTTVSGYPAIVWMAQAGITTGYADGTYGPEGLVTRKQMAQFLYRLAGQPSVMPPAGSPFPDVSPTGSGYAAIVWMEQTGITTGYADGTYGPNDEVTRKQMAAFLKRYFDAFGYPAA
ncbi:S-layer homology domain-containing protein [Demequina sp.]|uniref:S-layer homology domain-containing protein n=1 Tax=Demequina sp. TaxID=2050685 RepID=UPI0025ECAF36|nr:S-layer homology domain-containing protein [Demequina sp.]